MGKKKEEIEEEDIYYMHTYVLKRKNDRCRYNNNCCTDEVTGGRGGRYG